MKARNEKVKDVKGHLQYRSTCIYFKVDNTYRVKDQQCTKMIVDGRPQWVRSERVKYMTEKRKATKV